MPDGGCGVVVRKKSEYADQFGGASTGLKTFHDDLLKASDDEDRDYEDNEDRGIGYSESLEWESELDEADGSNVTALDVCGALEERSGSLKEGCRAFWVRGLATLVTAREDALRREIVLPCGRKLAVLLLLLTNLQACGMTNKQKASDTSLMICTTMDRIRRSCSSISQDLTASTAKDITARPLAWPK